MQDGALKGAAITEIPVAKTSDRFTYDDALAKYTAEKDTLSPELRLELLAIIMSGGIRDINEDMKAKGASAEIAGTLTQDEDGKVAFGILTKDQLEDAREIADTLAKSFFGKAVSSGNPVLLAVGAGALVSVGAYFDALEESDPMLIVLPGLVPAQRLTEDAIRTAAQTAAKITKWVEKNPGVPIAPTIMFQAEIVKTIADAVGRDVGEVLSGAAGGVQKHVQQGHYLGKEAVWHLGIAAFGNLMTMSANGRERSCR